MEPLKNNAYEALILAQTSLAASDAKTTAITNLTSPFNDLKGECGKLRNENMALREQNNSFELYSRKRNLILHGITDTDHENNTTCISTVKTFFKCNLKINATLVNGMNVENCHRLQQRHNQVSRDIIVRFQSMTDKDAVCAAKTLLRNTSYGISNKSTKTLPHFQPGKKKLPKGQASLKGDILNINGLIYTLSTIYRLQGKLHHNNFNERSNKDTLVFGGVLSEYHELSNWAPAELYYNIVKHRSIEHAYMHTMAKTFKDEDTAADIMDSPDAQSARNLMQRNGMA